MSNESSADRLLPLPSEEWSAEQREQVEEIIRGPRGMLAPPFVALLRSPELAAHAQRMGEYLRFRSAIEPQFSELAILLVASHWSQQVEWIIHSPIAIRAGVASSIVTAIGQGERPSDMNEVQTSIYEFCTELLRQHAVSDESWGRIVSRFGEKGVVDLIGITGYYSFLGMLMNASRTGTPPAGELNFPPLITRKELAARPMLPP
jgi:4-carboxymuconolactone decarboxylase